MTIVVDPKAPCAVLVCPRQAVGRQVYCKQHYVHWRKTGTAPTRPIPPVGIPPLERFLSKVNKTDTCWLWTTGLNASGYGQFSVGSRTIRAHRFAYEALVGPIPDGMQLDHLCRNRTCVNPDHLEPVTSRTNTLRSGVSLAGMNATKTHCKHGHEFTPENTYTFVCPEYRRRVCRTCRRAEEKRRTRAKQRASAS